MRGQTRETEQIDALRGEAMRNRPNPTYAWAKYDRSKFPKAEREKRAPIAYVHDTK